jgi:polyhydroxyalkanoate synthesis regulator phasin
MIGKMKSITSSNSISNIKEKYSKKRLSNITNRIRSLEKDISKLKNKEHLFNS